MASKSLIAILEQAKNEEEKGFNPDRVPPILEQVLTHAVTYFHKDAKEMGRIETDIQKLTIPELQKMKERVCRCCGLDPQVKNHPIPLCCDNVVELADYGSGYVAFFSLTKLCFWLCFVFIIFNIDKIKRNVDTNNCFSSNDPNYHYLISLEGSCGRDWVTVHSIANYGYGIDYYDKGVMLGFFGALIIILTLYYPYFKGLCEKIDKASSVPSDWTIQMKNVSDGVTETDVENLFNNYEIMPGVKATVYKVNSSYDLTEYEVQNHKVQVLKNKAKVQAGKEAKKLRSQFTKQKTEIDHEHTHEEEKHLIEKKSHHHAAEGSTPKTQEEKPKKPEVAIKIDQSNFSKEYLSMIHELNEETKKVVNDDPVKSIDDSDHYQ